MDMTCLSTRTATCLLTARVVDVNDDMLVIELRGTDCMCALSKGGMLCDSTLHTLSL